ncbi:uncharacterized protein LOC126203173 isoform X1 [Schistocerca nitens]|uniref:uncharacterized protein LOC126203173 isoform X1 n=1 Tax=Schistocerca nitens TaxID=7011 RepID=UPI002119215C|nr:uncharacterized protein LOC126203173 isoform X1 [Schistocerca nitens]
MTRALRLPLTCGALAAAVLVLWRGPGAAASSPWRPVAGLLSGVAGAAGSGADAALGVVGGVGRGLAGGVGEVQGVGRKLVKGATWVAGAVSGETAGRFLELVGLNSTCAGEAEAGCRRVVDQLVTEYLDVDDASLTPQGIYEALKKRIVVHPGTKWCGAGNVARSEDDAGVLAATDACCRRHDGCPENLAVGEQRYGLTNTCSFTRSHCECDREFYRCLKDANTLVSLKVGVIYFSILRPQCYEETYPVARCKSYSLLGETPHCSEYELDRSGEPRWQWLDNPHF